MNIIDAARPLNTKDKIDSLVGEIRKIPNGMSPEVRNMIFMSIDKAKVQMYFNEKYPESMFTDKYVPLPELSAADDRSPATVAQSNATSLSTSVLPLPFPFPMETCGSKKGKCGTYVEMAFHNLFLNLEHIYATVFGRKIMDEAKTAYEQKNHRPWDEDFGNENMIWKPMFDAFGNARPEEKLKIDEMLNRHFPMLVPFMDSCSRFKDYNAFSSISILESVSKLLRILRHIYSHFSIRLNPKQEQAFLDNEKFVCECLDTCYRGACRIVKERFAFDDERMKCTEQFTFSTEYGADGRPAKVKKPIPAFKYALWKKAEDRNRHFTAFGLVFFVSLFLEKKYSRILSEKLKLVAEEDKPVVCEMLSVYRLRLNSQRINVTNQVDALALDIINEVQRCPKELFEMLPPEKQKHFRIKPDEPSGQETLMVRHSDRFPQLLMKYIDDACLFSDIRFQVSLGKYFYRFYDKRCIDSSEKRVRAICKSVNGFGRITEIEKMREECWGDLIRKYEDVHKNTADEKPYVTEHHAKYLISDNRIGMKIMEDDAHAYLPELTPEGAQNLAPACWLSTYELPAMAFLLHLTDGSRVEEIIKSTVANYRRFFEDVHKGVLLPVSNSSELESVLKDTYHIHSLKDIPQSISNYLLRKTRDADAFFIRCANNLLDRLVLHTEYKLKKYNDDLSKISEVGQNKIGKKSYVQIKPGALASFLARDIMFFQPNDSANKNKLTGLNYRILQAVLATYAEGQEETLRRTLVAAHIIGDKNDSMCNPIMQEVFAMKDIPKNTKELYKAYLETRLSYLKRCRNTADLRTLHFLHGTKMKWQEHDDEFVKIQAARYLRDEYGGIQFEKAIELPRGLFEPYIREELRTMPSMKALADDSRKNIAYLIYGYFKMVMNDDCQEFYEEARSYRLLNILYRTDTDKGTKYFSAPQIRMMLNRKHKTSVFAAIDRYVSSQPTDKLEGERKRMNGLLASMKNSETDFKRYRIQDMLLFLIAKKVFLSNSNDAVQVAAFDKLKLRDIQKRESLTQKVSVRIEVCSKNGYQKVIKKDDLMLKHYANLYQMINDRRLPSLLNLVRDSVVEYDAIFKEFERYDSVQPEIMDKVLSFERKYLQQNQNEEIADFADVIDSSEMDPDIKKSLRETRNAFAHSAYPKKKHVNIAGVSILPEKAKSIYDRFSDDLKNNS